MSTQSSQTQDASPGKQKIGFWRSIRKSKAVEETPAIIKEETKPPGNDLETKVANAKFPLTSKAALIAALGGEGTMVTVKGGPPMMAEEVADLCFAEEKVFKNPEDVPAALYHSSWIRSIVKGMHLASVPVKGPNSLTKRVGYIRVEGIKVKELASLLDYPIVSITDLLDKLAKARKNYAL